MRDQLGVYEMAVSLIATEMLCAERAAAGGEGDYPSAEEVKVRMEEFIGKAAVLVGGSVPEPKIIETCPVTVGTAENPGVRCTLPVGHEGDHEHYGARWTNVPVPPPGERLGWKG